MVLTKRQQVESFILEIMEMQNPSVPGEPSFNVGIYKDMFSKMDDKAFDDWMHTLNSDPNAKLALTVPPLKVVIAIGDSLKVAKRLGIEVFERLRLWDPKGQRYCLTPEKYLVVRIPVRRLKQYLLDGLSVPDSDRRLNPLTDQVVKPDKGSAISFPQAQMIAEKGLTGTLHELMNYRGGDLTAYAKMISEIEETGTSDMSVGQGTDGVKSVQTLRTFLNAMHLESNL